MTTAITPEHFTTELLDLLGETFEQVQGMYLDRGTSLFETLEMLSSEEASIPVGGKCATLAAQVDHVRLYLEMLEPVLVGQEFHEVDWDEAWRSVGPVTAAEWAASQARLRATYDRLRARLKALESWDNQDAISVAMSMVVHTAYHLGEIRQALCTLK